MLFSHKSPQSSERVNVAPARRHSTTISMMENSLAHARTATSRGTCRWEQRIAPFSCPTPILIFFCWSRCVSTGLASSLRILPLKPKKTPTQILEPRGNSSFLKGSWEGVWGRDADDVGICGAPSPRRRVFTLGQCHGPRQPARRGGRHPRMVHHGLRTEKPRQCSLPNFRVHLTPML